MKITAFTTLLLFSVALVQAQVKFDKRIEFELSDGYSNENIVEFGNNGLILYAYEQNSQTKDDVWNYQLYNTDLEKLKSVDVSVPPKFYINDSWHNDDILITLFKNRKGDYILSSIVPSSLKESRVKGKLPKKAYIANMTVFGDYAYFNMSVRNDKFLYSINWKTGKQDIIPVVISGYSNKNLNVTHFQLLEQTHEVFLYIQATKGKVSEMYIMKLDDKGEKTSVFKLTDDIDKNLIGISAQSIGEGKYLYTGTYARKKAYSSEGIFFCEVENNKVRFIKYYRYSDLKNFYKYLPKRKQDKIEKKIKKKESKGKTIKIKYLIAVHKMKQLEDGYMFLGEAYYPTYRTYTTTTYVNGMPQTQTHTEFDGYQYTHAVVVKFDSDGNLIWDQIFKMWTLSKPYYVKKFISIVDNENDNELHIVFADAGRIVSKAFNSEGKILYDRTSDNLETKYAGDKSKWTVSHIDFWYDHYFVSYGTQKIKNKEGKDKKGKKIKRKRKVYFVSKIKY